MFSGVVTSQSLVLVRPILNNHLRVVVDATYFFNFNRVLLFLPQKATISIRSSVLYNKRRYVNGHYFLWNVAICHILCMSNVKYIYILLMLHTSYYILQNWSQLCLVQHNNKVNPLALTLINRDCVVSVCMNSSDTYEAFAILFFVFKYILQYTNISHNYKSLAHMGIHFTVSKANVK